MGESKPAESGLEEPELNGRAEETEILQNEPDVAESGSLEGELDSEEYDLIENRLFLAMEEAEVQSLFM